MKDLTQEDINQGIIGKHQANFREVGYTVIENALSEVESAEYKSIVNKLYTQYKDLYITTKQKSEHGLDSKDQEEIVFNLHNKDFSFLRLLDHPVGYPVIKAILQEGSYKNAEPIAHLNSAARNVLPGFPAQQMHIDSRLPGSPFTLTLQAFYLLDDFTEENGATRFVPGSQTAQSYPETGKFYDDEILLTGKKGSLILFNGACWHGASAKKNDADRWALIFTFGRWFLKPSFDFNRNMPKDFYDRLNDTQKELMGYKFNPSLDEFTRVSTRSSEFEPPHDYQLPN